MYSVLRWSFNERHKGNESVYNLILVPSKNNSLTEIFQRKNMGLVYSV
jgi:hypothetical protein